jgi:hypothetical protein
MTQRSRQQSWATRLAERQLLHTTTRELNEINDATFLTLRDKNESSVYKKNRCSRESREKQWFRRQNGTSVRTNITHSHLGVRLSCTKISRANRGVSSKTEPSISRSVHVLSSSFATLDHPSSTFTRTTEPVRRSSRLSHGYTNRATVAPLHV